MMCRLGTIKAAMFCGIISMGGTCARGSEGLEGILMVSGGGEVKGDSGYCKRGYVRECVKGYVRKC